MTIATLIARLQDYPADTRVLLFDPEDERLVDGPTGFLYSEKAGTVELCTDDPS